MHAYSLWSLTEAKSADPVEATALSASIKTAIRAGKKEQAEQDLAKLGQNIPYFDLENDDPFAVICDLADALFHYHARYSKSSLQLVLVRVLHAYVDLTVLKRFQNEGYKIYSSDKEAILIKLFDLLKGLSERYL